MQLIDDDIGDAHRIAATERVAAAFQHRRKLSVKWQADEQADNPYYDDGPAKSIHLAAIGQADTVDTMRFKRRRVMSRWCRCYFATSLLLWRFLGLHKRDAPLTNSMRLVADISYRLEEAGVTH